MFAGGVVFGPMTDRFGRQKMYVLNLAVFVICSLAHLFVHDVTTLFILRFIMGLRWARTIPSPPRSQLNSCPEASRAGSREPRASALGRIHVKPCNGFDRERCESGVWRYILASAAIPSALFLLLRL